MDPIYIGVAGLVGLVVLLAVGMPVGFAMALIGGVGFSLVKGPSAGLNLLARDFWDAWTNYSFTVIPLFVVMGTVAFTTGMSGRLYRAVETLMGRMRGGLLYATIVATGGFSAICGSPTATAAAMGRVALPEMRQAGYNMGLAAGCVAAAGTMGIMIPPSTMFIIYGILTQQSIGKLFIAGVIPGLIEIVLFFAVGFLWSVRYPDSMPAGHATTMKQKVRASTGFIELVALFLIVLGGLFSGLFSPTQAAAVGVAGALVLGAVTKSLKVPKVLWSIKESVVVSTMVLTVLGGASVLGHFLGVSGMATSMSGFLAELSAPPMVIMGLILGIYLIAGCLMDPVAFVVLSMPIIFPTVQRLGFDPIWFGVLVTLLGQMATITPPVGINVYITKGLVPDVPMGRVFKAANMFLLTLVLTGALLLLFPKLATWLPSFLSY